MKLSPLKHPPDIFIWSESTPTGSEFSVEDPLALDYLGQQVGLWLFPGLTTRTTRAQYYAMALYGLRLAEIAIQHYSYPNTDEIKRKCFERWEKFWALATVENHWGNMESGHIDSMRGIKGALKSWSPHGLLPLDYKLIERQLELGGLGAYVSSLRYYKLVGEGSYRILPIAEQVLDSFWAGSSWHRTYESYALRALDFSLDRIERKSIVKLSTIGDLTRLSSIRSYPIRQDLLWRVLIEGDKSTSEIAASLISASNQGIRPSVQFITGLLEGKWGDLSEEVQSNVRFAYKFGQLSALLLKLFNQLYESLLYKGWTEIKTIAESIFAQDTVAVLHQSCEQLLNESRMQGFRSLNFHGPEFCNLLRDLIRANQIEKLRLLLRFHLRVQRSRRDGTPWVKEDQGQVNLIKTNYNGYKRESQFPNFKFSVVYSLLQDLGKIPQ